jgi:membrane protease YdiL (CAAX protease family)
MALLLATLLGGLFGLIYMRTGSLWLPAALHFTWNFVENDLLNLSADASNPNLLGAVTRLRFPLTMSGVILSNQIVLETFVATALSLGIWLWLRNRRDPMEFNELAMVPSPKEKP